ncbi:MAG: hypothetical protein J2P50_12180, partial [Hyphomicrobiaceae bacterium]|nr:hypothetical protein [Hyphomicrobiaceae bacterium]
GAPAPAASHSPTAVAPSPISLASAPPEEAGKARPKPLETGQTEKEKAAFDSEARPAPDHGSRQSSTPGSESMPASDVAQVLTEQGRDREEARVEDPRKLPIEAGRGEVTPSTQPGAAKGAASLAPGSAHKWADVRNPRFGFSLAYPTDLLVEGPERSNQGTVFHTRDGRASLSISAATTALTLAAHWRSLVDGPYRGAAFDYTPRRAYWFVLSGTLAGSIFYQRVTLSCDRRMVHSWKLVYPAAERDVFDPVVEEIHRRYTHSNGAGARCGEVGR